MIRSMTGFGRAQFEVEGTRFDVEARSVNHRFLDLGVRLPRALSACEPDVRARVSERVARGKVDVSVALASGTTLPPRLELDLEVAARYIAAAEDLRARHDLTGELEVGAVLALPGVARTVERELVIDAVRSPLLAAVDEALAGLLAMRTSEGARLESELRARMARVLELVASIEERAGLVAASVRERLRKRAEQLRQETGFTDESRLAAEIVSAADRLDVTEELVRLRSHVTELLQVIAESGPGAPAGRRLDFLMQELGRETNTIGSKGSDAPIAHLVVELKTELERVREQVQNVE